MRNESLSGVETAESVDFKTLNQASPSRVATGPGGFMDPVLGTKISTLPNMEDILLNALSIDVLDETSPGATGH